MKQKNLIINYNLKLVFHFKEFGNENNLKRIF